MFDDKQAEKTPAPAPSRLAPEPALSAADEAELLVAVQAEVQAELAGKPRPRRHPRHIRHARLWDVLKRAVQENLLGQHVRGNPLAPGNHGKHTNEVPGRLGHLRPAPPVPGQPAPLVPTDRERPAPEPLLRPRPVPLLVPPLAVAPPQAQDVPRPWHVATSFYAHMDWLTNPGRTRIDLAPVVAELRRFPSLTITITTNVAVGARDSHAPDTTVRFTDDPSGRNLRSISARELMLKRARALRTLLLEEGIAPDRIRVAPGRVLTGKAGLRSTIIFQP